VVSEEAMTAPVCFVDTETTGLDPDRHEIWEVGLILPDDSEHRWFLAVDLGQADPFALKIGGFHDRHPQGHNVTGGEITMSVLFARQFARLTRGLHLAGAVVSFDEERLRKFLRANGACPEWHYHLVDVEALVAGWIAGQQAAVSEISNLTGEPVLSDFECWTVAEGIGGEPPWKSDDLSRAVGVEPDRFERHTALGDARWAKAIYDAVMTTP
jgi:DNA polymerase III epsilon subunit-like protein